MPRINRGGTVEDTWHHHDGTPTKANGGIRKRWRARYTDDLGRTHSRSFDRKSDAKAWLTTQLSTVITGTHAAPGNAKMTLNAWCDIWIESYGVNRASTVRQARVHLNHIRGGLGRAQLGAIKPVHVTKWLADLKADGVADSTLYAIHSRLAQIMQAAVKAGMIGATPCDGTAPDAPGKREYFPATDEVWRLHDAMPEHLQAAVLLAAFAGLRVGEVCGLRVSDVDFLRKIVWPKVQPGGAPLKTKGSSAPIPVAAELIVALSESVRRWPGITIITDGQGAEVGTWLLQRALREAKAAHQLPEDLDWHSLRHHYAAMLIHEGADILKVQRAMRHAKASTTLEIYGHLWPSADDEVRSAASRAFSARLRGS